jgi:hypothetical protein
MKQEISLELIDDKVKVTTPYHEIFVMRARNLRGKWENKSWWFDDSIIDYVRDLMIECFNTTGEEPFDTVNLLVSDFSDTEGKGPVTLFGRTIARAYSRDSDAKLGDDIVFISGSYGSGGSVKHWNTIVRDATFEIQHFPLPATELPEVKKAIEDGWVKIKYPTKKRKADEILAEIKNVESRLLTLKNELADV